MPYRVHLDSRQICSALPRSGRQDLNLRPPGPQPGALPDCATPRGRSSLRQIRAPTTANAFAVDDLEPHRKCYRCGAAAGASALTAAERDRERATRIELVLRAWKALVQPIHHARAWPGS